MNDHVRIGRDSLYLLLARFGTQGAFALFTILIARRLGSAGLGEYAFLAAFIFIGNMLTTFGTDMLLIRDIASNSDYSRLFPSLLLQLILSALFILVVLALPQLPGQSSAGRAALRLYSFSLVPLAFSSTFSAVLRGRQRMDRLAGLNLVTALLQLGLTFFFITPQSSILRLAGWLLSVQVAAAIIGTMLCRAYLPAWRISRAGLGSTLRQSASLAFLGLISMVYQRSSPLMITFALGAAPAGWFSAAARCVEFAKTGHTAVFTALYPALAKKQDPAGKWRIEWLVLLLAAAMAAAGLSWLASPLILFLFGADFASAVPLLRLLPWVLIPYTINTFLSLSFIAAGEQRPVLYAWLGSLFSLLVLNAWWLPRAGAIGSVWAFLCAESLQAVILLYHWKKLQVHAFRKVQQIPSSPTLPPLGEGSQAPLPAEQARAGEGGVGEANCANSG